MNDFRGPLPLRDSDFDEVRRRVISKIERRTAWPLVLTFATAAAAVIVLVVVLRPHPAPINKAPAAVHRQAPVIAPPPPPMEVSQASQPKPKPRALKPEHLVASGGPPAESEIYMNIQTADPNVRIIWIARQ